MVNTILIISGAIILLALLIAFIRFIKGPHAIDRVISFDLITIGSIALIGIIAVINERIIYLDVALVYGLLSFLAVIIIGKYLEKGL
ncbi:MAG: cation:proton antiporter [Marinilabiliales bacterium]|nr:MAG: cation:proton antiporter [Marinilabiliales bacterium]